VLYLALSVVALAVGPVLHGLAARRGGTMAALDSFVFLTVSGLVLLHLIPHAVHLGGVSAGLAALAGLLGPALAERLLRRAARQVHLLFLIAALLGLGGHALLDGVALAESRGGEQALAVAIVLHRVPDGLTVWWLLRAPYGAALAAATLALMAAATVAGFFVGGVLVDTSQQWLAALQAFVAGSLVHVVLHRPHALEQHGARRALVPELVGGIAAAALLAGLLLNTHERGAPLALTAAGAALLAAAVLVRQGPRRWTERLIGHHEHEGHDHDA
jgi:zinc transporter ZupT